MEGQLCIVAKGAKEPVVQYLDPALWISSEIKGCQLTGETIWGKGLHNNCVEIICTLYFQFSSETEKHQLTSQAIWRNLVYTTIVEIVMQPWFSHLVWNREAPTNWWSNLNELGLHNNCEDIVLDPHFQVSLWTKDHQLTRQTFGRMVYTTLVWKALHMHGFPISYKIKWLQCATQRIQKNCL